MDSKADTDLMAVPDAPIEFDTMVGIPMWPMRIKYFGLFDWEGLYKMVYNWYQQKGYFYNETNYSYKVPTPMGAEMKLKCEGWRKTNDYMREWIYVYYHFFEMREVEVIKDGKKQKLTKARFYIELTGMVEMDYHGRWKQTLMGAYLKEFYHKFIIKKHMELMWWDRLYYRIYKLHGEIKQFLDMQGKENAYYDVW
ncbi:hypothetical protein COY28_03140 [Candidatus Woesearchaeota archaeon CG_4_10_14_0_2_um_filter_57_5]|nr:MAG: hypothetical protein AUJ68_04035 [Candidatus Woesearchaeota archaeon CG1_02_57_44]PIN67826.1 MAG: hypothetical protein COV94_06660 [Candidatus Woesearchaeota archaeon CG11_big_fil_rev_8_21_14_0_20_57_5]PIZ53927.1 MAG: hypothetical protein COY28_03140 [Candidatus Woesearchaeota archaeon CG_4_10_14_0_2_um_filter_57_5]